MWSLCTGGLYVEVKENLCSWGSARCAVYKQVVLYTSGCVAFIFRWFLEPSFGCPTQCLYVEPPTVCVCVEEVALEVL